MGHARPVESAAGEESPMTSFVAQALSAFGLPGARVEALEAYDLAVLGRSAAGDAARRRLHLCKALLRAAMTEIDGAIGDGAPWILLKGEPLERVLFGGELARSTSDIDLLVLPGDLDFARRRLTDLGYEPVRGDAPRMWAHNQQAWIHRRHNVVVEIHWSPALPGTPTLPLLELFDTSVALQLSPDLTVRTLRPDWLLLHLALHFHHHVGFAKGLLDIAGWCDRFGPTCDEQALLQKARSHGLHGLLQWPLHSLYQLTGQKPPLFDDDVDTAVRAWAAASTRAMERCLQREPRTQLEASLVAVMTGLDAWRGVPLQALSMLTLDGWPRKMTGFCRPFILGPHRIGRQVDRLARWAWR